MIPRIFICGTGRSGTWILYKALNCHDSIHTFPREMRFLVDSDGLLDLVDALTINYHPIYANEALYRFERLMKVYLTVPDRAPYRGFDFPHWLGADHYFHRLDQFIGSLVEFEYEAEIWQAEPEYEGRLVTWAKRIQGMRRLANGKPFLPYRVTLPRQKERVVRYFDDRSQLMNLAASFVDEIFLHVALENDKKTWCEKTPQTLFNLDFILELFPESLIVHIKRDPRGVVQSLASQFWAPKDIRGASLLLRNMMSKWFKIKEQMVLDGSRYLEVKLEDFAEKPLDVLEEIASLSHLENSYSGLPEISLDRVNNWQKKMTAEDIQVVNEVLGPYIEKMGYTC
jgi:hypothetical protein